MIDSELRRSLYVPFAASLVRVLLLRDNQLPAIGRGSCLRLLRLLPSYDTGERGGTLISCLCRNIPDLTSLGGRMELCRLFDGDTMQCSLAEMAMCMAPECH